MGSRPWSARSFSQHADVNTREIDGTTALHWAVRSDDRESVQLLLRAGAQPNVSNRYGVTPLSLAATNGNPELVKLLLESGADPNTASPEGETALMTAAHAGNPASVVALLDHGADVNATEHWFNETALMWAAAENHAEVTRTLIDHGADINARSLQQEFARFRFNLATMVNTVLPRGGLTALMLAARQGAVGTARVLVDAWSRSGPDRPRWDLCAGDRHSQRALRRRRASGGGEAPIRTLPMSPAWRRCTLRSTCTPSR